MMVGGDDDDDDANNQVLFGSCKCATRHTTRYATATVVGGKQGRLTGDPSFPEILDNAQSGLGNAQKIVAIRMADWGRLWN